MHPRLGTYILLNHSATLSLRVIDVTTLYCLLTRVGSGDISAHRCELTGSCSSSVQYSVLRSILIYRAHLTSLCQRVTSPYQYTVSHCRSDSCAHIAKHRFVQFAVPPYCINISDRLVVHLSIHASAELRAHHTLYLQPTFD